MVEEGANTVKRREAARLRGKLFSFGTMTAKDREGSTGRTLVRIAVNGVILGVEQAGSGVPLLLVHGFPLSSQMWAPVLPALAEAARVIALDLRGFGESDAPPAGYTMEALAEDVMAVADALGLGRFLLGGHSMGGYVAFRVAARWPERLAGLILVATRAEADDEGGRQRRQQAIERILGGDKAGFLDDFLPNLLAPATRERAPRLLGEWRRAVDGVPAHVLAGCMAGMRDRPDSRSLLPGIQVPALIVVGAEDAITPPATAQAMAATMPQSRLVVISECGHTPPLERPVAVAEALLDFLRAHSTGHTWKI